MMNPETTILGGFLFMALLAFIYPPFGWAIIIAFIIAPFISIPKP